MIICLCKSQRTLWRSRTSGQSKVWRAAWSSILVSEHHSVVRAVNCTLIWAKTHICPADGRQQPLLQNCGGGLQVGAELPKWNGSKTIGPIRFLTNSDKSVQMRDQAPNPTGLLTPGRKLCLNLQTFYTTWRISFLFTATPGYLKQIWKDKLLSCTLLLQLSPSSNDYLHSNANRFPHTLTRLFIQSVLVTLILSHFV